MSEADTMFGLVVAMRQGTSSGIPQAYARYAAVEDARVAAQELMRDARVLRVMVVHNTIPPSYAEWLDR